MNSIDEIDSHGISLYVNAFRKALLGDGYFEHTLPSLLPYKVTTTPSFAVAGNQYLRYGTEPDVWRVGDRYDRFFWIGSLFRHELNKDRTHAFEFTLVDFYMRQGTLEDLVAQFESLLRHAERALDLPPLSSIGVVRVPFQRFGADSFRLAKPSWVAVTGYPVTESFYDTLDEADTNKFELYYVGQEQAIEIASAGVVGPNVNPLMYVENIDRDSDRQIFEKQFAGLGFGVARLAFVYELFRRSFGS